MAHSSFFPPATSLAPSVNHPIYATHGMVLIQMENTYIYTRQLHLSEEEEEWEFDGKIESMTEIDARLFPHSPLYSSICRHPRCTHTHYDTVECYLSNGIAFVVTFIVWNDCDFEWFCCGRHSLEPYFPRTIKNAIIIITAAFKLKFPVLCS